ncbi:MAG: glycosyltransferase family 4 protein [Candidatus Diapherotrites archaeon]|nr:glycosyltransferase family 4 protein [Candidatus Diapherotrites archaeon]
MKVLFVVSTAKDSGIFTSANALAEKLREKGVEVEIDNLLGNGYDLVHFHNPLPTTFFAARIKFLNLPFVCTTNMTITELDGLVPNYLFGLSNQYLQFYYSHCDRIICTSRKIEALLGVEGFASKTVFMPLGIDNSFFRPKPELGGIFRQRFGLKRKVVLAVASAQKRKGIFDFVEVSKALPQYDFVWVGGIPQLQTLEKRAELEKIVAEKYDNLVFTGYLSLDELLQAYNACDVFVSPTYAETFGLNIVEAASCGKPAIVRDLPDLDNFDPFALKFSDNEGFARQVCAVMEDESLRNGLSEKSLKESAKFSLEANSQKILEIYERLVQGKN